MRIGLLGKSKLGFVDGRFSKSRFEPELHDQWEKVNVIVLSWIMNVVRPGVLSSVVYASNAHKFWENLRERFDKVKGARVQYLHKEIHSLTQGSMTMTDYFSKLRDLWDKFDAIMPCPSCPCPESIRYLEHFEYQRPMQFLTVLNESYSQARKSIESTTLFSNKRGYHAGNNFKHVPRKCTLVCEYCHLKGHTKENCYKLVGYPPDFKSKRRGGSTGNTTSYTNQINSNSYVNKASWMTPHTGEAAYGANNAGMQ
ncbi:uncharacterized protein [Nicotiana tomentosiformis]|uniref:uncharacterized protein n=1 Tax=Nicotiana tomentosiformis TaxID=4098 RepID=UPI00388C40A9